MALRYYAHTSINPRKDVEYINPKLYTSSPTIRSLDYMLSFHLIFNVRTGTGICKLNVSSGMQWHCVCVCVCVCVLFLATK